MDFSCERGELHIAIQTALKAVSAKSPKKELEGILIEAFPTSVRFTGYDMRKAIYTTVEAEVESQGNIILNGKMLAGIVSALPEGTVRFQTENMNVRIQGGNSEFSVIGMDAADYPELPDIDGTEGVNLPQDLLGKMIRQTIFAVSDNESRPVYTGELFEIENGYLTLVAVDGYRLSLRRETVEGVEQECKFIVPGVSLGDLEKLCGDRKEPVEIRLGEKHISFRLEKTVLISRRLDGEFMNYHTTVPERFSITVSVERGQLISSIQRAALIIDDRVKNPLRCTFKEDTLKVASFTQLGRAEDYCPIEGNGNDLEIGFNYRFLLDALRAAPADELKINLNTASSPCVITPADEKDNFLYMILPVRLRTDV